MKVRKAQTVKGSTGIAILFQAIPIFLISAQPSYGWGDFGHQAVAEIAERNLSQKAKDMVFDILGGEPLAVSAIFPDLVRADSRFKAMAPYHFIEIPNGSSVLDTMTALQSKKSADTIISKAPAFITRSGPTKEQKQLLLKYLIHVVGDVHQPLHVGNGADMGANLCKVKWMNPETGKLEDAKLHGVWDDNIFEYSKLDLAKQDPKKYFGYQDVVAKALQTSGVNAPTDNAEIKKKSEAQPEQWYEESRALHSAVYPDKNPGLTPETRPYCELMDKNRKIVNGAFDKEQIPVLGEEYARKALALAHKQIALGGFRLAHLLNEMAESYSPQKPGAPTTKFTFESLIESVQLEKQLGQGNAPTPGTRNSASTPPPTH